MGFHFLIQALKILNQVANNLIQRLKRQPPSMPDWQIFSSKIVGLRVLPNARSKSQPGLIPACPHSGFGYQSQPNEPAK
jgi:hypothetical protein